MDNISGVSVHTIPSKNIFVNVKPVQNKYISPVHQVIHKLHENGFGMCSVNLLLNAFVSIFSSPSMNPL